MIGVILREAVKNIACEEWEWVAVMVVSFCNIDVTKVSEFVSVISARMLGSVSEAEEGSDINIMKNDITKEPNNSIYIYHYLVTSVNDSEMITQKFLRPDKNHWCCPFVI